MVERTQTLIVRSQKGFHSGVQSGAGYTFTRDRTAMQPESTRQFIFEGSLAVLWRAASSASGIGAGGPNRFRGAPPGRVHRLARAHRFFYSIGFFRVRTRARVLKRLGALGGYHISCERSLQDVLVS